MPNSEGAPLRTEFSIECVVVGRNDDYEPKWATKLESSIAWNRSRFEGTRVDFRVAFVEWNPPAGKPLLSPGLVEKFPYLRAIVVEPDVHAQICEASDLQILLTYAFNPALRTTAADYVLITGGDDFIGTDLARRIIDEGLEPECLYRAERVNVRRDLSIAPGDISSIERPENIVDIDSCSEPPYDEPPYTNASGDFLLLDSGAMAGLRGLDESVKSARLHIDSRFCLTAMSVIKDCRLLGRIFHIDHEASYKNKQAAAGKSYKWNEGLPYVNGVEWGLAGYYWNATSERIYSVSSGAHTPPTIMPEKLSVEGRERAKNIHARLVAVRNATQPPTPRSASLDAIVELDLANAIVQESWGSTTCKLDDGLELRTSPVQWGYALLLRLRPDVNLPRGQWHWLVLELAVLQGAVGIGLLKGIELLDEWFAQEPFPTELSLPLPWDVDAVVIRNAAPSNEPSIILLRSARVVSQRKPSTTNPATELIRS